MTTAEKPARSEEQLQQRLADLNAEIRNYPGPITGCDAQFNHLLEERARLNAELAKFNVIGGKRQA